MRVACVTKNATEYDRMYFVGIVDEFVGDEAAGVYAQERPGVRFYEWQNEDGSVLKSKDRLSWR